MGPALQGHLVLSCFTDTELFWFSPVRFFVFLTSFRYLQLCGSPVPSTPTGPVSPTVFAHLLCLGLVLVTLTILDFSLLNTTRHGAVMGRLPDSSEDSEREDVRAIVTQTRRSR